MTRPQAALLPDGQRLHLHHGPIDLIIDVRGAEQHAAYDRAIARFDTVLTGLTAQLPALRREQTGPLRDPIARRMKHCAQSVRARLHDQNDPVFVTPMAAVAGAVADDVLAAMRLSAQTPLAYVNNGGDIAIHLSGARSITLASPIGPMEIAAFDHVRGVATSGWGGRSHSLGIADAVTVTARTAAEADVAATLIANAVDLPNHPAISRIPAADLSPDSDLGGRMVTVDVGPLTACDIRRALERGRARAQILQAAGLVSQVALRLQGTTDILDPVTQGPLTHA